MEFTEHFAMVNCWYRVHETSTEWWNYIVMQVWDDEQRLQNIWIHKSIFLELCQNLPQHWSTKTPKREQLSHEGKVEELWSLLGSWKIQIPTSQFWISLKLERPPWWMQWCKAIHCLLEITDGFEAKGFLNCSREIDGTYIPNLTPNRLVIEYINQKDYFSLILQALMESFHWHQCGLSREDTLDYIQSCTLGLSFQTKVSNRGCGNIHSDPWKPTLALAPTAHEGRSTQQGVLQQQTHQVPHDQWMWLCPIKTSLALGFLFFDFAFCLAGPQWGKYSNSHCGPLYSA